mgnify:CR=1 FL=1
MTRFIAIPHNLLTSQQAMQHGLKRNLFISRWWVYLISFAVAIAVLAPLFVLIQLASGADGGLGARSLDVLWNTLALTALTVLSASILGSLLAVLTSSIQLPFRKLWLILLSAPLAVPSYIGAFTYFAASGPGGEFEGLFGFSLPSVRGLWGTALVMTLYTYPFVLLPVRASLSRLDVSQFESARLLGMSSSGAFRRVVFPRLAGGMAAGSLLVALYTLSDFATPAILGLNTFTRSIYVEYNAFGLDKAAMLSLQLMLLVVFVLFLETRVRQVKETPGQTFQWNMRPLSKFVLMGGMLTVVLASIGLPIALFGHWLVDAEGIEIDLSMIATSAYPAAIAAFLALLLGFPVALAATWSRFGKLLERVASLGFGIPGIVLGTAFVYIGLQIDFLYQTMALFILGYVLRFLPLAVGSLRVSLDRMGQNLGHAARSLGAGPWEVFYRVQLPLLLPGMVSAWALVYLEAMRELPLALLLRPTGVETLTTRLWQVYEAGYFGKAAVPALLLMLISMIAVTLVYKNEMLVGGRSVKAEGNNRTA